MLPWTRGGGTLALPNARLAGELAVDVPDPRVRTSFYLSFADVLLGAGLVAEATQASARLREDSVTFGLGFAEPWVLMLEAKRAYIERRFRHASLLIDRAESHVQTSEGVQQASRWYRSLLKLTLGRASEIDTSARAVAELPGHAAVQQSHLATLAIAAAVSGDAVRARELARNPVQNPQIEVRHVGLFAIGIAEMRDQGSSDGVRAAAEACAETSDCLSLIIGYRAYPSLLPSLTEASSVVQVHLKRSLEVGRDIRLARSHNISVDTPPPSPDERLSKREREVLALLADGLTNREIAHRLFIAEATAKLHVRRILAKTGTRSRTEAALQARE
jgi:ATP/maltotriose-dependent transcriptional regulator MalT